MDEYLDVVGGTAGALAITGVAAAATYYVASRPTPVKASIDIDQQTDCHEDGKELIRTSRLGFKGSKEGQFLRYLYDDAKTLYECFRRGARESNNGPCLGWRDSKDKPYQWLHYNESLLRAKNLGAGLVAGGLQPGQDTCVGVYAQNSPEWILTEQAVYCFSMVIVPLYDTLGPEACAFIIDQANITVCICEDDAKANMLLDQAPRCLKKIVHVKPIKTETKKRAAEIGITTISFEDVEKIGSGSGIAEIPPKPEDLATICYTSGTTGNPKGVMLTHENVVADVAAVILQLGEIKPNKNDCLISFLPLAHMLERVCEVAMYMVGASVGFYMGDIRTLMDDLKALRPTLMPAVPRLLNRIYDKVHAGVSGSKLKSKLLQWALNSKKAEIEKGIIRNNSLWDKLVFKKLQDSLGGRLRLVVVGSAPLACNVLTFMRCALGCVVLEGYGQTESVAPTTLTLHGDPKPGHVGPPTPCCCLKLVDVTDMEYFAASGQGEVCIKGTNVFKGYYKDPVKTKETLDEDGWLHTGDIGQWMPNGALKIIDRKKHIFKLSQGEYVAPEKVENIYLRSPYVSQIFVHGESLKSCVVAIVVPDVDVLKKYASKQNIAGTLSILCANPQVKALIMEDLTQMGKEAGLKSFEQVKDVYLHPDPFSIQNDLLTPTLKSKRPQLRKYFKPQIEDLYSKLI